MPIRLKSPPSSSLRPAAAATPTTFPTRFARRILLLAAAGEFGHGARVPVSWLVAANDSYFSADFSRKLADAFRAGGGKADFRVLPAYDGEGHWMAETENGVKLAAGELDRALKGQPHRCRRRSKKHDDWPDDDVILYDGVCVFCSRWIASSQRATKRNAFALPRSSRLTARGWRKPSASIPTDPDTNAVIHGGVAYFKSDAALTVLSSLPGWGWTRALFAVPKPLRNAVYNLVAKNRYRIFGKYEACFVPDEGMRARVME